MTITIRQVGPCFAGEVDGIDLARPLSPEDSSATWSSTPPSGSSCTRTGGRSATW